MAKIKLMTFNIQHGRNHNLSGDVIDLSSVAKLIKAQNADIVGINEIRKGVEKDHSSGLSDQPRFFSDVLGYECYFGKAIALNDRCDYGNAILSRFHIEKFEVLPISDPPERTDGYYYESRCILRTDYIIEGKKLTVLNSHFGLAPEEQTNAVDKVISICNTIDNSIVLMGDFNMTPDYRNIQRLYSVFDDVHKSLGTDRCTYPSNEPKERIDYIFVKGAKAVSADTINLIVSDHFAITATVQL